MFGLNTFIWWDQANIVITIKHNNFDKGLWFLPLFISIKLEQRFGPPSYASWTSWFENHYYKQELLYKMFLKGLVSDSGVITQNPNNPGTPFVFSLSSLAVVYNSCFFFPPILYNLWCHPETRHFSIWDIWLRLLRKLQRLRYPVLRIAGPTFKKNSDSAFWEKEGCTIVVDALSFGTGLINRHSMDLHTNLRVHDGVGFVCVNLG